VSYKQAGVPTCSRPLLLSFIFLKTYYPTTTGREYENQNIFTTLADISFDTIRDIIAEEKLRFITR
jgi:hypothetical protein